MEKNEAGCGETWVRPKDSLQTNYMSDKKKTYITVLAYEEEVYTHEIKILHVTAMKM